MMPNDTLTCANCGREQSASAFTANPRMRSGRSSWCRACTVAATRRWRAANRETINAARRVHYPPRPCPGCGVMIAPKRADSKFCCGECRSQHRATDGHVSADWARSHASHCGVAAPASLPAPARGLARR